MPPFVWHRWFGELSGSVPRTSNSSVDRSGDTMRNAGNRRVALCIGIDYTNDAQNRLAGCVNDSQNMEQFLHTDSGYDTVVSLNESAATRDAIMAGIRNLGVLTRIRTDIAEVFVYYAGHGVPYRIGVSSAFELDMQDEAIVPYDWSTAGVLSDNDINRCLKGFRAGCRVRTLFDCCHSGTMADLRFTHVSGSRWTEVQIEHPEMGALDIIHIGACRDNQLAEEAWSLVQERQACGAMTGFFLLAWRQHGARTVFDLVTRVRQDLIDNGYRQIPQISATRRLGTQQKWME